MLILASQSPRRREMFDRLGVSYKAISTDADETVTETLTPDAYVITLAKRKAAAAKSEEGDTVVAADTVVALENEIFGKPEDREDAIRMITALSGRTHKVYTAFAIRHGGKVYAEAVATDVTFRPLTEKEIAYYVDREQPYDKAGAYAIQEMAGVFVEALSGNFDNVVGLPLCQLELALKREFGISLFDFVE